MSVYTVPVHLCVEEHHGLHLRFLESPGDDVPECAMLKAWHKIWMFSCSLLKLPSVVWMWRNTSHNSGSEVLWSLPLKLIPVVACFWLIWWFAIQWHEIL